MKKCFCVICFMVCMSLIFTGCSNKTVNLAKDLDATIKNFVTAVSSLDWPEDGSIETLSNLNKTYDGNSNVSAEDTPLDTAIDTSEIYTWLEILHSKINIMLSKRADLLLYINEIHGGNANLTEADQLSLKVYMNILKDNSNYLSSYKGMLKNQINEATNLYNNKSNINAINAYIIKAVETLQVRSAKIDTSILAMNSIIDIIGSNLINNYFNYNKHDIKNNPESDINKPSEPSTVPNEESSEEESTNNDTPIPNNNSNEDSQINQPENNNDDAQNAIDFESNTTEVEKQEKLEPTPAGKVEMQDSADDNTQDDDFKMDENFTYDPTKQTISNNTESDNTEENINNSEEDLSSATDKKISRETVREKIV